MATATTTRGEGRKRAVEDDQTEDPEGEALENGVEGIDHALKFGNGAEEEEEEEDTDEEALNTLLQAEEPDSSDEEETFNPDKQDGADEWPGLSSSDESRSPSPTPSREASIEPGYSSDSSTSSRENTIGNVPLSWYDDLPHIGYTVHGKKILRPATQDALDDFLRREEEAGEDGLGGIKSIPGRNGEPVQLSPEELDLIKRLTGSSKELGIRTESGEYDVYTPTVEYFTAPGLEEQMPIRSAPEPKSRFIRSKWEHDKIIKLVRGIRAGRIMPRRPLDPTTQEEPETAVYDIWANGLTRAEEAKMNHPMRFSAPKMRLPNHDESYNPPREYLLSKEEEEQWTSAEKEERDRGYLPRKYDALRKVPGYTDLLRERFERCLDLYLAPRVRRSRLVIDDPQSLLPQLPSPESLRPFPTYSSIVYPHPGMVRTLSIDPSGMWLLTGADDGVVRLWELHTGRCEREWRLFLYDGKASSSSEDIINHLAWSPNSDHFLFAVAKSHELFLIGPHGLSSPDRERSTGEWLGITPASDASGLAKWSKVDSDRDTIVSITSSAQAAIGKPIKHVTWHRRGDYLASVAPEAGTKSILIHQCSKSKSQAPFNRNKGGEIQLVEFHPLKPHLFVATRQRIREVNLQKSTVERTLMTGFKWISSLSVHSNGDHLLAGSYDKKLAWFDLDLSSKPYKTLRYHTKAIRSVTFHPRLPLFLSASDDTTLNIFHGMVSSDLSTNPVIVPLRVLSGHHKTKDHLGLLAAAWHPRHPWCVTAGADGQARLWVN